MNSKYENCDILNTVNFYDKIKLLLQSDKDNYSWIIDFIQKNFSNDKKKYNEKKNQHLIEDFIRILLIYSKKPLDEKMILYLLSKSSFLKRLDNSTNYYKTLDLAHARSTIITFCSLVIYTSHYCVSHTIYKLIYYCINIINLIFDSQNKNLSYECKLCISILKKEDSNACMDLTMYISNLYNDRHKNIVNYFLKKLH
jgi:hypothetical protein